MKKVSNYLIAAVFITAVSACSDAPKSDEAKTTGAKEVVQVSGDAVYVVDANSSTFTWIGTKVSGYHSGAVKIKSGEIQVINNEMASGRFVIEMATIDANGPDSSNEEANTKLTGHLMSPDFFDVQTYPESVFEVTSVKAFSGSPVIEENDERQVDLNQYRITDPSHMISGNLTVKGITKNIEFPAKVTMSDNTMQAVAKFNIDRRMWDITYPGMPDDMIKDMIHIGISLNATRRDL
jgi:polyisoprenoid-binding protein YceI